MTFQKGNQLYKLILNPGRKKEYTPQQLGKGAMKYFKWIDENPLIAEKIIAGQTTETSTEPRKAGQKKSKTVKIVHPYQRINENRKRPYTLEGLCNHLGISVQTFHNYQADRAFFDVCTAIRQ